MREVINRGMAVIGGNPVYHNPLKFYCVPESFWEGFNQIEDGLGFKYSVHESCLAWDSCFSTAAIIIDY